jgi:hypothetical protein
MSENGPAIFHYSVRLRNIRAAPSVAHHAGPMSPRAALLATLLLSLSLWGVIWLAVSSLVAVWPW